MVQKHVRAQMRAIVNGWVKKSQAQSSSLCWRMKLAHVVFRFLSLAGGMPFLLRMLPTLWLIGRIPASALSLSSSRVAASALVTSLRSTVARTQAI